MADWNGFGSLDLSEVQEDRGRATMLPGNYICKITNAEMKDTKDKAGKGLIVEFADEAGSGKCDVFLNLVNRNEEAQRIGRSGLKTLLIASGHPNPDRPGDVNSMVGLRVGVRIEQGEDWTDKNGNTRPGGGKVRRSGAFFSPDSNEIIGPLPVARRAAAAPARSTQSTLLNDDIPF